MAASEASAPAPTRNDKWWAHHFKPCTRSIGAFHTVKPTALKPTALNGLFALSIREGVPAMAKRHPPGSFHSKKLCEFHKFFVPIQASDVHTLCMGVALTCHLDTSCLPSFLSPQFAYGFCRLSRTNLDANFVGSTLHDHEVPDSLPRHDRLEVSIQLAGHACL
jgi:hypothetical protein